MTSNYFRRARRSYGNSTIDSGPYQRAVLAWDDRIGGAAAQAANWRLAAIMSLVLSFIAMSGYIYERNTKQISTYVVPVDDVGRPGRVRLADQTYTITGAEASFFVSDWVRKVRSEPTDPIVLRQNWAAAYSFTDDQAQALLNTYARTADPFARVGKEAVDVDIISVLARSPDTLQVDWRETNTSPGGRAASSRWTGLFTYARRAPANEAQLLNNPLGLQIRSFSWSRQA